MATHKVNIVLSSTSFGIKSLCRASLQHSTTGGERVSGNSSLMPFSKHIRHHPIDAVIAGEILGEIMKGVESIEARVAAPPLHPQSLGGRPQLLYLARRRRHHLE